mmetsp:Transcript_47998/g.138986  ORF Transcript_47998/g.138986 Transcript_47998/m.138986 type:complete len:257 (+) Transcript_47998:193-963(+)
MEQGPHQRRPNTTGSNRICDQLLQLWQLCHECPASPRPHSQLNCKVSSNGHYRIPADGRWQLWNRFKIVWFRIHLLPSKDYHPPPGLPVPSLHDSMLVIEISCPQEAHQSHQRARLWITGIGCLQGLERTLAVTSQDLRYVSCRCDPPRFGPLLLTLAARPKERCSLGLLINCRICGVPPLLREAPEAQKGLQRKELDDATDDVRSQPDSRGGSRAKQGTRRGGSLSMPAPQPICFCRIRSTTCCCGHTQRSVLIM